MTSPAARKRGAGRAARAFNASFDGRPGAYEDLRAVGHMARRRADYFNGVLDEVPGDVLEVGCGTGTLLRELAARRPDRCFVGVEPLPDYVEFARRRADEAGLGNVHFHVGTGEMLRAILSPASTGLVVSVDALHHMTDLDRVVAEVRSVTAPTGRWRVMEPNRAHPYVWAYHVLTSGERTFAVHDFLGRARRAGWRLVDSATLFLYPSGLRSVPLWAEKIEHRLEGLRPLAGAIVLDLAVDAVGNRDDDDRYDGRSARRRVEGAGPSRRLDGQQPSTSRVDLLAPLVPSKPAARRAPSSHSPETSCSPAIGAFAEFTRSRAQGGRRT